MSDKDKDDKEETKEKKKKLSFGLGDIKAKRIVESKDDTPDEEEKETEGDTEEDDTPEKKDWNGTLHVVDKCDFITKYNMQEPHIPVGDKRVKLSEISGEDFVAWVTNIMTLPEQVAKSMDPKEFDGSKAYKTRKKMFLKIEEFYEEKMERELKSRGANGIPTQ